MTLVERLREHGRGGHEIEDDPERACREAADEIERLNGQLAQLHGDFLVEQSALRTNLAKCAYALWRVAEDSPGIAASTLVSHYGISWNELMEWTSLNPKT